MILVILSSLFVLLSIAFIVVRLEYNVIYVFSVFFIIKRDNAKSSDPFICRSFMHGLQKPWYRGKGIQIRLKSKNLQIGVCRPSKHPTEEAGVLDAIGGRYLDESVEKIGNW